MAMNDNAVFTASTGYVFKAEPGTAAPTPVQLANFEPETFGSHTHTLKPSGEYTLTVEGESTLPLEQDASAAEVQAELQKLASVGNANVIVAGTDPAEGYFVHFVGDLFGQEVELTADEGATITEASKPLGWEPIGHTAAEELPEFGYEGGETENRGTWQKQNLRQVSSETPVDYVTIRAQQFDLETLELYYGKNASKVANVFGVDDPSSAGVDKAFLIVLIDGDFKIAFSAAKATVGRDESIALATDDFATLPLRATFVKHPGRHLFEWTLPEAA